MTTEIRNLLETRLADIDTEAGRLQQALEALGSDGSHGRRSGSGEGLPPKPTRRNKGKRAARGERQRQLVEAIGKMSGASPSELADAIHVSSTQVHTMIRSLQDKGRIKKKGQGFVLID
jgi:biotin operon repressor